MGYILARIHELKAELAAIPEVDPATREVTKLEAIRQLEPEIAGLRRKGYRLGGVITLLAARGVPITIGTLRTYLRRLDKQREGNSTGAAPSAVTEPPPNAGRARKTRTRAAGSSGKEPGGDPASSSPGTAPRRRGGRPSDTSAAPPQQHCDGESTPPIPDAAAVGIGGPPAERPPGRPEEPAAPVVDAERAAAAPGTPAPALEPERPSIALGTLPVTPVKASFAPREDSEEI